MKRFLSFFLSRLNFEVFSGNSCPRFYEGRLRGSSGFWGNSEQTLAKISNPGRIFKIGWSLILFFPFFAYSASAEFSPKALFIQVFNFSIFLFLFLFLVKKTLQTFFHKRQKDFFAFEEQALKLEREKQKEKELWDGKLKDLNNKEKNIQKQAQTEGERFRAQKRKELEEFSERLKKTSEFFLNLEKQKLRRESLSYWKAQLVESARRDLSQLALFEDFQKAEQTGFINLLQKQNEKRGFYKDQV
ncbi:MAG: hypothetical protein OXJ52_07195 [Oligoflexia bacterium]|nr:hypothetical protein [Oligoflexia bacterium]